MNYLIARWYPSHPWRCRHVEGTPERYVNKARACIAGVLCPKVATNHHAALIGTATELDNQILISKCSQGGIGLKYDRVLPIRKRRSRRPRVASLSRVSWIG